MEAAPRPPAQGQKPKKKLRVAPTLEPLNANECIRFHFVSGNDQIPTDAKHVTHRDGHPPLFTNQVFEDEEITGYGGLQIDIAITTDTYVPFLLHKFSSKQFPANDYVALLTKEFTEGLPSEPAALKAMVEATPTLQATIGSCPHLKKVHVGSTKDGHTIEMLQCNMMAASDALRQLHARMHPLVRFNIDGASELEQSDERMELLFAVQMCDGEPRAVMGLLTFFKFYVYPHNLRFRVAQIVVTPSFQKQGVGAMMLHTVNELASADAACIDVTFEDPAEELQALRERLDVQRCLPLPTVRTAACACVRAALSASAASAAASSAVASTSSTTCPSASEVKAQVEATDVISRLDPPAEACAAIRSLKISPHAIPTLWDALLWVAAMQDSVCSQDSLSELLQRRVLHRELKSVADSCKSGEDKPENKVLVDLGRGDERAYELEVGARVGEAGAARVMLEELGVAHPEEERDPAGNAGATDEDEDSDEVAAAADDDEAVQGDANGGEEAGDGEEEASLREFVLEFLMYRTDPRSREARKRLRLSIDSYKFDVPDLNEDALESLMELTWERIESIERIVKGIPLKGSTA